jgi:two-component system, NarL family, invasion response regulator UvrY
MTTTMTEAPSRARTLTPTIEFHLDDVAEVAIVGASSVVRSGLAHVLTGVAGLRLSHQVDSITRLPSHRPVPLVVVDLYGRPGSAFDAAYWSLLPRGSRAIALCLPDDPPNLIAALHGGVHALLTRESDTDELIAAVQVAQRGGLHIAAELFESVVDRAAPRGNGHRQDLTTREIEALKWIAEGLTHGQISRRMGLTEATVSTYIKRIRHKLNVGNKAELTRRAIELGYVDPR